MKTTLTNVCAFKIINPNRDACIDELELYQS